MEDYIIAYSADLSNLKVLLDFKIIGSTIKAKSFKKLDDGTLILYWNEDIGTPLITPLTGHDLYIMLAQYFKVTEVTEEQFPGDGSNVKGYMVTTNPWMEKFKNLSDVGYISLIFKPVWIYYGK